MVQKGKPQVFWVQHILREPAGKLLSCFGQEKRLPCREVIWDHRRGRPRTPQDSFPTSTRRPGKWMKSPQLNT